MSDTAASKEYSDAEFKKIINKFNTYRDYKATVDDKGNEKPTGETGVVESNEGANIEERIAQLYSETYRKYNTVILGYSTYNDIEELIDIPADELTDNQKINSQFVVKTNKGMTTMFFDTLRFHNRPIYCGVNVLYDPTVSNKFVSIANSPTEEYFDNPWNAEYENPEYNSKDGSKTCRDLCFNKTFLEDLQAKADDESELVMAFMRKGFDVGIGEVNGNNLTSESSIIPPMYGRVFENMWRDKIVAYSPVIMQSIVSRDIPVVSSEGEIVSQISDVSNNNCYFTCPSVEVNGVKQEAIVKSATITKPSIIYVGENIPGYSLFSYINVPVCSWEYFKKKSSGFGSSDPSKPTKVVQRLEDTQCCGPFMRIKAKGYYTSETNEVLRGYTTIKLKYDGKDVVKYEYEPVSVDGKEVWGGPEGPLSDTLKNAAKIVYEDHKKGKENPMIRFLTYATEADENRDELYENAYIRDDQTNPNEIKNIFKEVRLPDRFAFYIHTNTDTICVAQFPCIPLSGAEPLEDDYITQWVPLYKKIETDPSTTETTWYINKFDILVKRGNNDAKFYNINRQKSSLVTYPAKDERSNTKGYLYTCNGVVYKGPSYKSVSGGDLNENKTKLKKYPNVPLYLNINGEYVEMIDGGNYSDYDDIETYPRLRKAKYIPDNIQGISLSTPNDDDTYISGPINIAQYNKLEFMDLPATSNIARASREGYKEFIKNGCVFNDGGSNDPKVYLPDTVSFTFDGKQPASVEPKVEAKAVEEIQPEPAWKNTVKNVLIVVIVVVILGLLIIIGCKIYKAFKGKTDNFTCPGYAAQWSR